MYTQKLRPKKFDDVVGQQLNVAILKKVIQSPSTSPKVIILGGEFGCGKTTSARILARELNKVKDSVDIENTNVYYEYDSTVVGNVEKIREMRDFFDSVGSQEHWSVVVFDEVHAVSNAAQTALLKILEEVKGKVFFVMCTTHVHKLLPTIRSRSIELEYGLVSKQDIASHLKGLQGKLGLNLPDDIVDIIAARSNGHMRDAHMLLDKYRIIGEELFRESVKSSIDLLIGMFTGIANDDKPLVMASINSLLSCGMDTLKTDFSEFMSLYLRSVVGVNGGNSLFTGKFDNLKDLYKTDPMKLVKAYFSEFSQYIFNSETDFASGMLVFYQLLKGSGTPKIANTGNTQNAFAVRR